MSRSRIRCAAASAGAVGLLFGVTAWGGGVEESGAEATSGSEASEADASGTEGDDAAESGGESAGSGYDQDLPDPGDDLLAGSSWGGKFSGATYEASWSFPETYETDMGDGGIMNTGTFVDQGTAYKIQIGAGPGDAKAMAAGVEQARSEAEADGQTVSVHELAIGDEDYLVLTQEAGTESSRTFFHAPDGGTMFYVVHFVAGEHLDETPQERLDELHQTVASLEFE
jgi:hypothetical protein